MFELYFGTFDLLLYGLAFIIAAMVSGNLIDPLASAQLESEAPDLAAPPARQPVYDYRASSSISGTSAQ